MLYVTLENHEKLVYILCIGNIVRKCKSPTFLLLILDGFFCDKGIKANCFFSAK